MLIFIIIIIISIASNYYVILFSLGQWVPYCNV